MRPALLLSLGLLPALAAAQAPAAPAAAKSAASGDRVAWALCQTGQGCQVCDTSLTHAQVDASLGAMGLISGNPGHIVTVMRTKAGDWTWYYDTRRPAPELDKYFGGPGRANKGACPPLPGDHQPRDGQWSVANGKAVAKKCPAGLDRQLASLQLFRSGPVKFAKPFRAADALPGQSVAWVQVAPNKHVGSFAPAGQKGMQARYELEVVSPEAMKGQLKIAVPIPGQPTCEVQMPFDYRRSGD